MRYGRTSILVVGACLVMAGACGKKGKKVAAESGDAQIVLPAGMEPGAAKLTVQPQARLPEELERFASAMQKLRILKIVTIEPATLQLPEPATLIVTISPAEMADKATLDDVRAFTVIDGVPVDLETERAGDAVRATVKKPGHVLFAVGPRDATLVGTPALVVRGSSELLMRGDCTEWLTADSPRVAALVGSPPKFAINDNTLVLTDAPKPIAYAPGADLLRADEILAKGAADPINQSVLWGSLLLATGHPVRLVAGAVRFERGGVMHAGVHQWVETLRDNKAWFVDTLQPEHVKLVPLAEATGKYQLVMHRTCVRYPTGTRGDPASWAPN